MESWLRKNTPQTQQHAKSGSISSSILRNFSPAQVYAQTMLAFKLIQADERIVGLNFVAPEDHRIALRDYKNTWRSSGILVANILTAKKL